jgi:hypothetical protein
MKMTRWTILAALAVAFLGARADAQDAGRAPGDAIEGYRSQCLADVAATGAFPDRTKANDYCLGIARSNAARDEKLRSESAPMMTAAQQKFDQLERDDRARRAAHAKKFDEEQRSAEAAERAEEDAKMKDPTFTRGRLSLLLCYAAVSRKHAQERLDDERQGARRGLGVINKEDVYEYQGELVVMSKLERLAKADLKARRISPIACKSAETETFSRCVHAARMEPSLVDMTAEPNYNEYTASANRIVEFSMDCAPWNRPPAARAVTGERPGRDP